MELHMNKNITWKSKVCAAPKETYLLITFSQEHFKVSSYIISSDF